MRKDVLFAAAAAIVVGGLLSWKSLNDARLQDEADSTALTEMAPMIASLKALDTEDPSLATGKLFIVSNQDHSRDVGGIGIANAGPAEITMPDNQKVIATCVDYVVVPKNIVDALPRELMNEQDMSFAVDKQYLDSLALRIFMNEKPPHVQKCRMQ